MNKGDFTEWLAFKKGENLAHEIFLTTSTFTQVEKYSLTDQVRRSSRSVCSNLAQVCPPLQIHQQREIFKPLGKE